MPGRQRPPSPPRPRPNGRQWTWTTNDLQLNEDWRRLRNNQRRRLRQGKAACITDDDVSELKAAMDLGLIDPDNVDPELVKTLPAVELLISVKNLSKSSPSSPPLSSSSMMSSNMEENSSSEETPVVIFNPGDDPEVAKEKLRLWANVAALRARHFVQKNK